MRHGPRPQAGSFVQTSRFGSEKIRIRGTEPEKDEY